MYTHTLVAEDIDAILVEIEWFVCLMRYRMGWTLADVAAALGTTVYQVRHAQDSLRERLDTDVLVIDRALRIMPL